MKKLPIKMVSAIALVDIDNKVLIAQRPKNKFMERVYSNNRRFKFK